MNTIEQQETNINKKQNNFMFLLLFSCLLEGKEKGDTYLKESEVDGVMNDMLVCFCIVIHLALEISMNQQLICELII
jgi:hypothetical protein